MATQHTNSMYFFFLFFLFHFSRFAYCTHTQCVVCIYVLFLHICQHLINFSFLLNISAFLLLFFAFALCNCALASAVTVCVCVYERWVCLCEWVREYVYVCVLFMTKCRSPFLSAAYFSAHTYALLLCACMCVCIGCVYVWRVCVWMCVCRVWIFTFYYNLSHSLLCVYVFFLFLHCIFFLSFSFLKFTLRRLCWRLLSTILHAAYLVYGWYFVFFFLSVGRGTGSSKLLYAYL